MSSASFRITVLILFVYISPMHLMAADPVDMDVKSGDGLNRDAVKDYNLLINQLETEHGPYDRRLSEPLLALGHALKLQGAYAEAAEIFRRALYVTRINEGLHSYKLIPLLEHIIECDKALQNWDKVDDEYHYLLWVYGKTYTDPDPAKLTAMDKVTGWHLAAFNLPARQHPARRLLRARELSETALSMAEELYGESGTELASRLYKLAMIDYFIAVGIQRGGDTGLILADSLVAINKDYSYYTVSRELVTKIYREGVKILTRIVSMFAKKESAGSEAEAMATVNLADWHLLFNRRKTAYQTYLEAYEKLISSGISEAKIASYFSRPVALPLEDFSAAMDISRTREINPVQLSETKTVGRSSLIRPNGKLFVSWSDSLPGLEYPAHARLDRIHPDDGQYAVAIFNLSEKGWAENIRIIDFKPDNGAFKRQARETLWSIQFRPVLEKGKAVSGMNYGLYYLMPE